MLVAAVSLAVRAWTPAVFKVVVKRMGSAIGAGEGVIGQKHSLGVGAGESYGPRVAGNRVAKAVLGRDREVVRYPGTVGEAKPPTHQHTGGGGVDRDAGLAALEGVGRRIRGRDRLSPGCLKVALKECTPGVAADESVVGGQAAWPSLLVIATVPVYPVTVLQRRSWKPVT